MAEEIRPNSEVSRGFVDTGRPGPTQLSSLAEALQVASESGKDLFILARDKELADIEDKLSSPLLSAEEIDEIEEGAMFPIAAMKARNRKGQLFAEETRPEAEDRLAKAQDVVEARKILGELQARDLARAGGDAAVQAGIREHYASIAEPLLREASVKRRQLRALEERENRNATLGLAARKDGRYLAEVIAGQVSEETLVDARNVPALHDDAVQTIINRYVENPASAASMLDTIDAVLETPGVVSLESDKEKYLNAQRFIVKGQETLKVEKTDKEIRSAEHRAAKQAIFSFVKSGTAPSSDAIERLYASAEDPQTAEKWLTELQKQNGTNGVIGTPAYTRALNVVKATSLNDLSEPDPIVLGKRMSIFNRLAAGVDSSVANDPALLETTLTELADKSATLADKEAALLKQVELDTKETRKRLLLSGRAAAQAGDTARAAKLAKLAADFKANPKNRIVQTQIVQSELYRHAESYGINMQDDVVDLLE